MKKEIKKIKMNIKCPICKKEIWLSEELAYKKGKVYHIRCILKQEQARSLKLIDKLKLNKLELLDRTENRIVMDMLQFFIIDLDKLKEKIKGR